MIGLSQFSEASLIFKPLLSFLKSTEEWCSSTFSSPPKISLATSAVCVIIEVYGIATIMCFISGSAFAAARAYPKLDTVFAPPVGMLILRISPLCDRLPALIDSSIISVRMMLTSSSFLINFFWRLTFAASIHGCT